MSRELIARLAAHESWAQTPDRAKRTSAARRNSPASIQWHMDRLHPSMIDASPADRIAAAESARSAFYARLALKSAQARKRAS